MTITAVVVAYWPDRMAFLPQIVEALKAQTHPVDNILIINNNKDHEIQAQHVPGADVINSGRNFTSRSKYAMAMLIPSDYYLLLDDDVCPEAGLVENYLKYVDLVEDPVCFSDYGMIFQSKKFHESKEVRGHEVSELTAVDAFIGRTQFLSFESIVIMLAAEYHIRLDDDGYLYDGEDILIAVANDPSYIVPDPPGSQCPIIEGSQRETMQDDWGYHILRDAFGWKAMKKFRSKKAYSLRGPVPGEDEHDQRAMAEYRESSGKRT